MTEYKAFLKLQVEAEQRVDGETYEVIYDANGGEGRMYNSIFCMMRLINCEKILLLEKNMIL